MKVETELRIKFVLAMYFIGMSFTLFFNRAGALFLIYGGITILIAQLFGLLRKHPKPVFSKINLRKKK